MLCESFLCECPRDFYLSCSKVFSFWWSHGSIITNLSPLHERFLLRNLNPIKNWNKCNYVIGNHNATQFCTCHDSTAVVLCAKFHSDHFNIACMRAEWNFHQIWITTENRLWNEPLGCIGRSLLIVFLYHYTNIRMIAMVSQIAGVSIVCSGADQRKPQSSASLAFVWGIDRWPVNSSLKRPVTRKMFPFDDVIVFCSWPYEVAGVQSRSGCEAGYFL